MLQKFLLSCLIFTFIVISCFSQIKNYKNEFGFKSDNDSYLLSGQDRYYTNGLFITFRQAIRNHNHNENRVKKIWEAEVGQYMYNPLTGRILNVKSIDRPFAAYLYAGGRLNWFLKKNEQVLQAALQVGTIGSSAKGKEAQETLHHAIGFYEIKGWEYQVKDEAGVNTSVEYTRLLKRSFNKKIDINLNSYLKAGNTFSAAGVGLVFRTGDINSLFQSVTTNSRISNNLQRDSIPPKELFFFAKPALHYIAYDASIQGGLFRENKGPITFDPKRLVFSQELGLMYAQKRWSLDFSIIFKSKEIKSTAKGHQYGSIQLFYRW